MRYEIRPRSTRWATEAVGDQCTRALWPVNAVVAVARAPRLRMNLHTRPLADVRTSRWSRRQTATRPAAHAPLYVPEGTPPTPSSRPSIRATWTGDLNLRRRERLAFRADVAKGSVSQGQVCRGRGDDLSTKWASALLDKGKTQSSSPRDPGEGRAFVRLSWRNARPAAARAAEVFTYNASAKEVAQGRRFRGRHLRRPALHEVSEPQPDSAQCVAFRIFARVTRSACAHRD